MLAVGLRHRLAAHEIAAHRVADRQRIAALAVAGHEPALEVGAPHRVGRIGGQERRRKARTALARPARLRQPLFAQPVADRAPSRRRRPPASGRRASGAASSAPRSDGARAAPAPPPPAPPRAPAHDGSARGCGPANPRALGPIARQPFVAGLAADPELGAKLAHHRVVLARRNHKSHSLVHRAGLSPRHRRGPPRRAIDLSTIYPVQSVSDLTGSNTPPCPAPARGAGRSSPARETPNQTVSRLAGNDQRVGLSKYALAPVGRAPSPLAGEMSGAAPSDDGDTTSSVSLSLPRLRRLLSPCSFPVMREFFPC